MMGKLKSMHGIAFILLVVGGLNWGLAIWNFDIATWGLSMTIVKIIYALVALSALYEIFTHGGRCKDCDANGGMNKM